MIFMAIIGEVMLLAISLSLVVGGFFCAGIACAMDSTGSMKHAWLLVWTAFGVAIGWAAIHYGPISITFVGAGG